MNRTSHEHASRGAVPWQIERVLVRGELRPFAVGRTTGLETAILLRGPEPARPPAWALAGAARPAR